MRIVIVGSGIMGLLTAVECVSAGHQVVVLDQGQIPCPEATSYDRHRSMRALHMKNPAEVGPAVRSHHRWIALQKQLATRFYEQVGMLTVMPPEDVPRALAMLSATGWHPHVLDPDELTSRYPHVEFPIGESAVLEPLAGVLLADRVLIACAAWLRRRPGVELRQYSKVVFVDDTCVRLADGTAVTGDALLLAGGPWSRELLGPELAGELVLYRQSMLYCDVPAPESRAWSRTPAMLSIGTDGCAWLVPPVAGTPLKLSAASACRAVQRVEDTATPACWREHLVAMFAEVIPGFNAGWLVDAPDGYYLARASTDGAMVTMLGERVVSYSACGGSSFKFAPLIARSLADRLRGAEPIATGLAALDEGLARHPQ